MNRNGRIDRAFSDRPAAQLAVLSVACQRGLRAFVGGADGGVGQQRVLDDPRVKIIKSTGCTAHDTVRVVQTKRKLAPVTAAYQARGILKFGRDVCGAFL